MATWINRSIFYKCKNDTCNLWQHRYFTDPIPKICKYFCPQWQHKDDDIQARVIYLNSSDVDMEKTKLVKIPKKVAARLTAHECYIKKDGILNQEVVDILEKYLEEKLWGATK